MVPLVSKSIPYKLNRKLIMIYIEFEPSFKIRKYDVEQNGKFQQIAQFDCRGLELVDFQPRVRIDFLRKICIWYLYLV